MRVIIITQSIHTMNAPPKTDKKKRSESLTRTSIAIPRRLLQQATTQAKRLKVSRSKYISTATSVRLCQEGIAP